MTVSQVLSSGYTIEGDEFFAEVTGDVIGDKGVIIPKGSVAHGSIKETGEAKRLGRDGYVNLSFDYIVTPDGREIPIEGDMTTKLSAAAETTKIIAQDVGYTAVGGAVGGLLALNWLGIEAAIASHGYTVAGGAAIGGVVGLALALKRKGNEVLIAPGDEIKVKVLTIDPDNGFLRVSFKQVDESERYCSHDSTIKRIPEVTNEEFKDLEENLPKWINETLEKARNKND